MKSTGRLERCDGTRSNDAMDATPAAPLLRALNGERLDRPPVWFMRQAGRYLPEYRALRATAPDFIAFCLDPEKASEVTLQPMRRLAYDAAIVFADILLVPMALGQRVWFEAGEGPKLGELPAVERLSERVSEVATVLANVGETLARVRQRLEPERALIGFAGAPWTVLTYMLQGGGGEREAARARAYAEPELIAALIAVLVEATADYLAMQVRAGAQALQLFESWAEGLPEDQFRTLVIEPHCAILQRLRTAGVKAPVIGFPRGAGALAQEYADAVPVQGVGLDTQASASLGRGIQAERTIQGALDPLLLRAGGAALDRRVEAMIQAWNGGPYIFNLGHGILPDTPIAHVEQVLARIGAGR